MQKLDMKAVWISAKIPAKNLIRIPARILAKNQEINHRKTGREIDEGFSRKLKLKNFGEQVKNQECINENKYGRKNIYSKKSGS